MTEFITIPSEVLEKIAERARANPTEEICGVVLRGEEIPISNNVKPEQRAHRFRMDPGQQMEVWTKWRREGDLVVYHSHPTRPAEPSDDDKWVITRSPDITFLIFALSSGWFKAYRFNGFSIVPVGIRSDVAYCGVSTQPNRRGTVTSGPT